MESNPKTFVIPNIMTSYSDHTIPTAIHTIGSIRQLFGRQHRQAVYPDRRIQVPVRVLNIFDSLRNRKGYNRVISSIESLTNPKGRKGYNRDVSMIEAMVFFNGRKGYNRIASAIESTNAVLLCHSLLTDSPQCFSQDAPLLFRVNRRTMESS